MPSTLERVKKIVADQLAVGEDEVTPSSSLVDDLGADELDILELAMAIEEEFGIDFDDDDIEESNTIQDIVNAIEDET